jgi:hypothetical protein
VFKDVTGQFYRIYKRGIWSFIFDFFLINSYKIEGVELDMFKSLSCYASFIFVLYFHYRLYNIQIKKCCHLFGYHTKVNNYSCSDKKSYDIF